MADIAQLEAALIKADAAGDTEGARILAAEIRKVRSAPTEQTQPKQEAPKKPVQEEASTADKIAGDPLVRFSLGAANSTLGTLQNLANGKPMVQHPLIAAAQMLVKGQGGDKLINENMAQLEEAKKAGMKANGSGSFDLMGLFGNLFDPAAYGAAKQIPVATSTVGKIATPIVAGGAFAGANPVTSSGDFEKTKQKEIGTGAAFGAVMKAATSGASAAANKVAELVRPLTETGRARMLYEYLDKLSGSAKAEIVNALNNASEYVKGSKATGGEAIADIPESTALAAFLRHLEGVKGDMKEQPVSAMYAKRRAEQEAARLAAVRTVGQDAAALDAAKAARTAATTPMREDALNQANIGGVKTPQLLADIEAKAKSKADALQTWGKTATTAAEMDELSKNFYPVPGMPKFPQRYTNQADRVPEWSGAAADANTIAKQRQLEKDFKEFQLRSLQEDGYLPLMADPVVDKVNKMANTPGASTITKDVFARIRDKIAERTKENGVIDARDLYTIRKEIGNDIATLAKDSNTWDKQVTGGLEKNIQSAIDAAIEKAGGSGWKTYLNTFKDMSKPVNQMEIGQFLEKKLTSPLEGGGERAVSFANAVREAPGTIKKASGQDRFKSLEEVLTPEQMAAISGVKSDLERAKKFRDLAAKTHEGDPGELSGKLVAPGLISTAASITNWGLKILRSGAEDKIATMAGKLDQNPQALATFMSKVPRSQMGDVVKKLSDKVSPESRQIIMLYAAKRAGAKADE